MIYSLEELEKNLIKVEHHLLYHLIMEQKETNRLLSLNQSPKVENEHSESSEKRDELVKKMYELKDRPRGWNKWNDEKLAAYLKEVS